MKKSISTLFDGCQLLKLWVAYGAVLYIECTSDLGEAITLMLRTNWSVFDQLNKRTSFKAFISENLEYETTNKRFQELYNQRIHVVEVSVKDAVISLYLKNNATISFEIVEPFPAIKINEQWFSVVMKNLEVVLEEEKRG